MSVEDTKSGSQWYVPSKLPCVEHGLITQLTTPPPLASAPASETTVAPVKSVSSFSSSSGTTSWPRMISPTPGSPDCEKSPDPYRAYSDASLNDAPRISAALKLIDP